MSKVLYINGKKIADAKEDLELRIVAKDVASGKTKAPDACAAAKAVMRQCKGKGVVSAHVHLSRVYVEYPDKVLRYITPPALRTEIVSFDRGHEFEAGTYRLRAVSKSSTLAYKKKQNVLYGENRKGPHGYTGKKRARPHYITGVRASAPVHATKVMA